MVHIPRQEGLVNILNIWALRNFGDKNLILVVTLRIMQLYRWVSLIRKLFSISQVQLVNYTSPVIVNDPGFWVIPFCTAWGVMVAVACNFTSLLFGCALLRVVQNFIVTFILVVLTANRFIHHRCNCVQWLFPLKVGCCAGCWLVVSLCISSMISSRKTIQI